MRIEIVIPQMGANITEGKLLRWFKKPGDGVQDLEPLYELETSKAVFEIESECAGTLVEITRESGVFKQGEVVGYMETE